MDPSTLLAIGVIATCVIFFVTPWVILPKVTMLSKDKIYGISCGLMTAPFCLLFLFVLYFLGSHNPFLYFIFIGFPVLAYIIAPGFYRQWAKDQSQSKKKAHKTRN